LALAVRRTPAPPAPGHRRKKSAYPLTQDPNYDPTIRARLLEALNDPSSTLAQILNADLVKNLRGEID